MLLPVILLIAVTGLLGEFLYVQRFINPVSKCAVVKASFRVATISDAFDKAKSRHMAPAEQIAVFNRSIDIHWNLVMDHLVNVVWRQGVLAGVNPFMLTENSSAHGRIASNRRIRPIYIERINNVFSMVRIFRVFFRENVNLASHINCWCMTRDGIKQIETRFSGIFGTWTPWSNCPAIKSLSFPDIINNYVWPRIGLESIAIDSVRFDHLLKLPRVDASYFYSYSKDEQFHYDLDECPRFPPWLHWMLIVIGIPFVWTRPRTYS